jgi:hypothetical protein
MNVPAMYIVGLVSNVVFLSLCLFGYFYLGSKNKRKWNFIIIFACAWLVSALSYVLLIIGISANDLFITSIRIISYVLFLLTIIVLILELRKIKSA